MYPYMKDPRWIAVLPNPDEIQASLKLKRLPGGQSGHYAVSGDRSRSQRNCVYLGTVPRGVGVSHMLGFGHL